MANEKRLPQISMQPYSVNKNATIYNCDSTIFAEEISLCDNVFVIADPPYGISERTNRLSAGRGKWAKCHDFPSIIGDDLAFDPAPWVRCKKVVLWGANHYANRLPASASWLIWDKRDGMGPNDNADGELAWTNLGGPVRCFHHKWSGVIRDSQRGETVEHPTQKPLALMEWIIANYAKEGDLIVDPYMGSGPVILAATLLGFQVLGFDLSIEYCDLVARKLANTLSFSHRDYPSKKKCPGCGNTYRVLPNITFNLKHAAEDGLQPWCRECDTKNKYGVRNGWTNFIRHLKARRKGEDRLWTEEQYLKMMGDFSCHSCGCNVGEWSGGYWVDRIQNDTGYIPSNCRASCWPCNSTKSDKNSIVAADEIDRYVQRFGRGKVAWGDVSPRFKRVNPRIPDLREFITEEDRVPSAQLHLFEAAE